MPKYITTISIEAASEEEAEIEITKNLGGSEVEILAGPNEAGDIEDDPIVDEEE